MTPQELESLFALIYGHRGWQKKLADQALLKPQTISSYMNGHRKISKDKAKYFTLIAENVVRKMPGDVPNEHKTVFEDNQRLRDKLVSIKRIRQYDNGYSAEFLLEACLKIARNALEVK